MRWGFALGLGPTPSRSFGRELCPRAQDERCHIRFKSGRSRTFWRPIPGCDSRGDGSLLSVVQRPQGVSSARRRRRAQLQIGDRGSNSLWYTVEASAEWATPCLTATLQAQSGHRRRGARADKTHGRKGPDFELRFVLRPQVYYDGCAAQRTGPLRLPSAGGDTCVVGQGGLGTGCPS